jgi:hypothetical protein
LVALAAVKPCRPGMAKVPVKVLHVLHVSPSRSGAAVHTP